MALSFDTIKNWASKTLNTVTDFLNDRATDLIDAEQLKEMADEIEKDGRFDREEAEALASNALLAMSVASGFTGAAAQTKVANASKQAFKKTMSATQVQALAKKALAKISFIEKNLLKEVTEKPSSWTDVIIKGIKKQPVLAFLAATQLDVLAWGPNMIAEGLSKIGFGDWFENREYTEVGFDFTNNQIDDITKSFHNSGYKYYADPNTGALGDLSAPETKKHLETLRQKSVAKGFIPLRETLLKDLAFLAKREKGEVKPTDEIKTTEKPVSIQISGLPFGIINIPPIILEKITNETELAEVAKNGAMQYINSIPDRLSFEIRRVKFWVNKDGKVLRPNPPVFTEWVGEGEKRKAKLTDNRIIVLDIYLTTHANKRTKVYEVALDYSIADNIITPPNIGEITSIQVEYIGQPISISEEAEASAIAAAPSAAETVPQIEPRTEEEMQAIVLPGGMTLAEAEAEQATRLRQESRNELERIALQEKTQFNFRMPNGDIIRAGIDPNVAATIDVKDIILGTTAANIPVQIKRVAREQMGLL